MNGCDGCRDVLRSLELPVMGSGWECQQHAQDEFTTECDGCGDPLRIGVAGFLFDRSGRPECNNPRAGGEMHWRYRDDEVSA